MNCAWRHQAICPHFGVTLISPEYALLVLPAVNRVYGQAAPALTAAELAVFGETVLGGRIAGIGHREIGGVPYVTFSAADALTDRDVLHLSNLSSAYALFAMAGDANTLRPVVLHRLDRYDDDLLTIPRYTGKTNESLTKLLLNLALVCSSTARDRYLTGGERVRVLDPLCGRGTTLHQAFMYGFDASGVEADAKAADAYEAFFVQWLQEKRIKHKVEQSRIRRGGKVTGHRTDIAVGASKADLKAGASVSVTIVNDDTRFAAEHFKRSTFDVLVADLPYGVQHKDRVLVADALPAWLRVLKPGAGVALAWNTRVLKRADLVAQLVDAGLDVFDRPPFDGFAHRVDRTIHRDVVVARTP